MNNLRIVLVEDDPVLSKNIEEALQAEDFNVKCFQDGNSGVQEILSSNPDCIVLDINLPGKNGYEICREIRASNSRIPVLFLTAYSEIDDKVLGFDSGGDDYLTKPFYMRELALRIQAMMRRLASGTTDPKAYQVHKGIHFYPDSGKVKIRETDIQLTPREFQILLMLAKANGDVVSKKALIQEIWGRAFDANTNTIEVYINFLRKKIDKPFGKEIIKTQFGFGYFLDEI